MRYINLRLTYLLTYLAASSVMLLITSDKGGAKCVCPRLYVCLFVCLLARLFRNACVDLDEMLRVDIMSGHGRTD